MHAWKAFNMKQRRHTNCSNLYWLYFNYVAAILTYESRTILGLNTRGNEWIITADIYIALNLSEHFPIQCLQSSEESFEAKDRTIKDSPQDYRHEEEMLLTVRLNI